MTEQETIQFPVIIDGVTKKKDGTLTIKLGTSEMTPEDTARIFALGNQQVWNAMKQVPLEMDDIDAPEIISEFKSDKTPSKRLRNTLFVLWRESGSKGNFDFYYKQQMEKLINWVKGEIEKLH